MPQSLAKICIHLVFSTKHRDPCLPRELQNDLHAYMGGTLNGLGCAPIEINSEPDHVHALFLLGRTVALSELIGVLKKSSNDWLRGRAPKLDAFHWQAGYGVFSVSPAHVDALKQYITDQEKHHQRETFQDEFRRICRKYGVEIDERYVWD